MTPEAQRIAIAKACGWHSFKMISQPHGSWLPEILWGMSPGMKATNLPTEIVPDYLNDLNAMHEAEKVLTDAQRERYKGWLHDVTKSPIWGHGNVLFATATQRAEAFLRTVSKWGPTND